MFVISLFAFMIQSNLGDPLQEMVGQSVSAAEKEKLREKLGLNDPFYQQYSRFLFKAIQGDLGTSYFFKEPTVDVILKKLPATLELVIASTILIAVVSILCGVYSAIFPTHFLSKLIIMISTIGISIPVFLTGIGLIYLFSINLGVMPSFGRGDTYQITENFDTVFFTWDGIKHLIMPTVTLSSIMLPLFIRLIRSQMMEELESDYIKFARAKGLSRNRIYFLHALKNTLLPVISVAGVQIGTMVAYTILTETVFQWPGMGFMFLEAVNRTDTPLIVAYLIFVGLIFVVVNTIVDITYSFINPTIRVSRKPE